MSSPLNARDYAGAYEASPQDAAAAATAVNGSSHRDRGEQEPRHRNYAWPHSPPSFPPQDHFERDPQQLHRQAYGQPNDQGHQPSHRSVARQDPHLIYAMPQQQHSDANSPSASSSDPQAQRQQHMASSTSRASGLRMSSDSHQGVGTSRQAQQHAQQAQRPSIQVPSSSSTQHFPSGASNAAHSRQTSHATTLGPSSSNRHGAHRPSGSPMRMPLRSRVFGLGKDLRPQNELVDPAFFPGGIVPPEAATLAGAENSKEQPTFSVELLAPGFDNRGYPVYSGKAAAIAGYIRMRKSDQADAIVKLSAHTTSGSAAAVWDGVALQPVESGSERNVFNTDETFLASSGKIEQLKPSPLATQTASGSSSSGDTAESSEDQAVLVVPFKVNLPLGGSTRMIDGQQETVAVALPPSFEMSSDQDKREKATLRSVSNANILSSGAASVKTSRTKQTAITLRDAVETGLQQVYRVGCFYRITVTLVKSKDQDRDRKSSGGLFSKKNKGKKKKGSEVLSIPFVFNGEITEMPPLPTRLPPIPPILLKQPHMPLGEYWISEAAAARWAGSLFRSSKRSVELEIFLPGNVFQAPGVVPFLLIIRPEDPNMLPQISQSASLSHPGSPKPGAFRHDAGDGGSMSHEMGQSRLSTSAHRNAGLSPVSSPVSSPGLGDYAHRQLGSHLEEMPEDEALEQEVMRSSEEESAPAGAPSSAQTGNKLSRLLRTSVSLGRSGNKDNSQTSNRGSPTDTASTIRENTGGKQPKRQTSRGILPGRRPNTAPSRSSSEGSGTESWTIRGGASSSGGSGGVTDLPGLVRVGLVQSVYYSSSNVNDPPKVKRRMISLGDLEEVDLDKAAEGRDGVLMGNDGTSLVTLTEARMKGVRALRGILRVGREATPTFRVQNIEMKYAVKVDLLPFNSRKREQTRSGNPSSSPPRTPPSRPSMHATLGSGGANTLTPTTTNSTTGTSRGAQQQQQGSSSSGANSSPTQAGADVAGPSRSSVMGRSTYQNSVVGYSEAGWTKRSPSDQTVLATEGVKDLHKTIGSLWVNVRMVKGRGSI